MNVWYEWMGVSVGVSQGECVYVCMPCAAYLPVLFCHLCPNNGVLGGKSCY